MKKNDQSSFCESSCENNCDNIVAKEKNPVRAKKQKKELSLDEKIYNFLEKAEKVAIFFANRQKAKRKKAKKQQKSIKKIGKIDKATGAIVLKGLKKDKPQKQMKRYKPKKKK